MPATPALLLDRAAFAENLAEMARRCAAAGVTLRPHVKGHKAPELARAQVEAGAVGVATATLREAAAMIGGGVDDVLVTSVLAPQALPAAAALADGAGRLALVVHEVGYVAMVADAARARGVVLDVLVDVDVGQRRGGATPGAPALAVAAAVAARPDSLRLRGVQGYEGHLQAIADPRERAAASAAAMDVLAGCVAGLRAAGHAVPWVTTAGTGTAASAAAHPVVTEVQPGSYALMDAAYAAVGGLDAYAQAVWVLATVTAVLGPDEAIVDAGTKALSVDAGPARVAGGLVADYTPAGDEHGRLTGELSALRIGDRVLLTPSHADTTVLLHDAFHPVGGGEPIAVVR